MSPILRPTAALLALVAAASLAPVVRAKAAASLPPFMEKACHTKDPKFNECAVEVGSKTIPKIINGNPKYRIPVLDPFTIPELYIRQGTKQIGLNLYCKNCIISGIKNAIFKKADILPSKKVGEMTFYMNPLTLSGVYNISGKILLLPITGNGNMKIDIKDVTFTYKYTHSIIKKSNGLEYMKMDNFTIAHKVGGLGIKFENLFNGDKLLGDNMNQFLNENWKELVKELGPAVSEALGQTLFTVLNGINNIIPFKTLFPE